MCVMAIKTLKKNFNSGPRLVQDKSNILQWLGPLTTGLGMPSSTHLGDKQDFRPTALLC